MHDHYFQKALKAIEVDDNGCWIWKSVNGRGYGYFGKERAHRVVWELIKGRKIKDGYVLDHRCPAGPNVSCVNPDHLDEVTQKTNMRRASSVKMTEELAECVRRSSLSGVQIAAMLGVSPSTISLIRVGKTWNR